MQPDAAVARLPKWMLGLALAGTAGVAAFWGIRAAGGFLLGAIGAWINLSLIVRAVDRIGRLTLAGNGRQVRPRQSGLTVFIQLMALVLAAFVILRFSGFSKVAVLCGFLVCPAAVILEIVYELVTYEHT